MSAAHAIKQVEERTVPSEIGLMLWSDRMDLVALSNVKGEVALHRLTKTRAWTLKPPKEGLTVKGISWRPDGKIIAIAYTTGLVILVEVETQNVLQVPIEMKSEITCIHWLQEKPDKSANKQTMKQTSYMKTIDNSSKFIPDPPGKNADWSTFSSTDESQKGNNILQEQTELNLLLIGTEEGLVHISIFGCFPCATLNMSEILESKCSVENVHLSEDLSKIFVTVKDAQDRIRMVLIDSSIFKTHSNELFAMGIKSVKLIALVNNLSKTITSITETWESILLEMDNKLSKYASKVAEGGVTADFLDLLMFGICSEEMKEFLIHDLTKKGLDKFGQTIEMSYSNIQKLLLKFVAKFGQNVTYHLAELRGMSRLEHRYKNLGLCEDVITQAISSNGSFMIKGGEMQQIINHSIINYKAFFRWLYMAIVYLLDEKISNEFPKMTQQDLAYITEFLQNFDHIGSKNQSSFKMERLGQYLSEGPLHTRPNMERNDWTNYLSLNNCVREHPSVHRHFEDFSLVQQFKHLKESIDKIFVQPKESINRQIKVEHVLDLFQTTSAFKMSGINSDKSILFAFVGHISKGIDLVEINCSSGERVVKSGRLYFSKDHVTEEFYNVVDFKFYSGSILTTLLQELVSKFTVIYQLTLTQILDKLEIVSGDLQENPIDAVSFLPKLFKNIEGMVGSQISVSGIRKVGIVLSENRRKVRVFEMEGDEEEEEDADMSGGLLRDSGLSTDLETSVS